MKEYANEEFASPKCFTKIALLLKRCSKCFGRLRRKEKKLKVCSHCMCN